MKKILCAVLALLMICTLGVSMASCMIIDLPIATTSIDKMEEKCEKLKNDGELDSYYVAGSEMLSYLDNATAYISANKDEDAFIAVEYDTKENAEEFYQEIKSEMEEAKAESEAKGEDTSKWVVTRKGNIVIYTNNKDLYNKIVGWI